MIFKDIEGTVLADYEDADLDFSGGKISAIAAHTQNTWQQGRDSREKERDTEQGKIAETLAEAYLRERLSDKIAFLSYDDIRNDNYEKHAPFDLLIWERDTVDINPVVASIQRDITASCGKAVYLSAQTVRLCRSANVKIAEIKSTKIRQAYKEDVSFSGSYADENSVRRLAEHIVNRDDFLCYPHHKRYEARENYFVEDYCAEVQAGNSALKNYGGADLRRRVIELECEEQICDIFLRVYLDTELHRGLILGWIDKQSFLDEWVKLKRMQQFGKSEYALYWAKSLRSRKPMTALAEIFEKTEKVFANPYTAKNFYHADKHCMFLRRVAEDRLIEFRSEEEAKAGGRYTKRCFNCYKSGDSRRETDNG